MESVQNEQVRTNKKDIKIKEQNIPIFFIQKIKRNYNIDKPYDLGNEPSKNFNENNEGHSVSISFDEYSELKKETFNDIINIKRTNFFNI